MGSESALTPSQVKRRQVLQGLLAGGAAASFPGSLLAGHPVHRHLTSGAAVQAADRAGADEEWAPLFLSTHQAETLGVLAERIVPGSRETRAERFVDLLLSEETQETRAAFLRALGAFEGAARSRFQRPFVALGEAEQEEILHEAAAREAAHERTQRDWGWFAIPEAPRERDTDLGDDLAHIKGWVAGAYFSSEKGMKELGWTGDTFFDAYPGCTHPGGHG